MSSCPHCGAVDGDKTLLNLQNHQLKSELRQANAVLEAINTLTENKGSAVMLFAVRENEDYTYSSVAVMDPMRGWSKKQFAADTRIEALQKAIAARDQYDRERKDP